MVVAVLLLVNGEDKALADPDLVKIDLAAEEAAGDLVVQGLLVSGIGAFIGTVEQLVVLESQGQANNVGAARNILGILGSIIVDIVDLDVADAGSDPGSEIPVKIKGVAYARQEAGMAFFPALPPPLDASEVEPQRIPGVHQVGLDKGQLISRPDGSRRKIDRQGLPRPGEGRSQVVEGVWGVEDVEVFLCQLDVAEDSMPGGESETKHDVAEVGHLVDIHDHVPVGRLRGRFVGIVDSLEDAEAAEVRVTLDQPGVVNLLARVKFQLPPDDPVLGEEVALDLDLVDVDLVVFFDVEAHPHGWLVERVGKLG